MKTIAVGSSLKDGSWLEIGESPWLVVVVEKCAGWYCPHWGFDYRLWNAVLLWCQSRVRMLVSIPVDHSCEIAGKLWGNELCYCDRTEGDS